MEYNFKKICQEATKAAGWSAKSQEEAELIVFQLAIKANAGYYNSHTEEAILKASGMIKSDRLLSKQGRVFVCYMGYASSNRRPRVYKASLKYRRK